MKKALLLVLIAVMLLSTLVFLGCKKKVEEPAPEAVEEIQIDTTQVQAENHENTEAPAEP